MIDRASSPRPDRGVMNSDPRCPLRWDPSHVCRNRDGVEREAAGQPALRPDSDCAEGVRAHHVAQAVELEAQAAALQLADTAGRLLATLRLYGLLPDVECEATDVADSILNVQLAGSLAKWGRP